MTQPSVEPDMVARIVESARECFRERGVRATRIADIAEGAGVVRQTVYDWVTGKDELVDLAMAHRTRELVAVIRSHPVDLKLAIGDQIVEVLLAMIDLAGTDPEFEALAQGMTEQHAFAFMAGPSALTDMVEEMLAPYFQRAQEAGVLRDELGRRALTEWTQLVLAPLRNQPTRDKAWVERMLRHFLVPALLR